MTKKCLFLIIALVASSVMLFGCGGSESVQQDALPDSLYGLTVSASTGATIATGDVQEAATSAGTVMAPTETGTAIPDTPITVSNTTVGGTDGAETTITSTVEVPDVMDEDPVEEQSPDEACEGYDAYQPKDTDVVSLPELSEVSPIYQPLMYDFLNSCLDWHVPIHRDSVNSEFYIMRNLNTPIYIYTDFYVIQDGYTVPPRGGQIIQMELEPERLKAMEAAVAKLPEERVLREGDWELLLLELHSDSGTTGFSSGGTWGGFSTRNFGVLYSYTDGNPRPFLEDGTGWPTSWLRREPYAGLLKESGIDIKDPWWDEWHYMGEYVLAPYTEESSYPTTVLTCTNVGTFLCDAGSNFQNHYLHWGDILRICDKELAYVEGKYTPFTGSINIG